MESKRTVALFVLLGSLGISPSMYVFHSCDQHVYVLFSVFLFSFNIILHSASHLRSVHNCHP